MRNNKTISLLILLIMMVSCNPTPKYTQDVNMEYVPEYPNTVAVDIEPDRIYKLTLERKRFYSLPEGIRNLSNLKELELFSSSIENWTATTNVISVLRELENLKIIKAEIDTIPINVNSNSKIKSIDLSGSYGYDFNYEVEKLVKLKKLQKISVGGLKIDKLPESFSKLKQLKSVEFGYHNDAFDNNDALNTLHKLPNLESLTLALVDFRKVPANLGLFDSIKKIHFVFSQIDMTGLFNKIHSWEYIEYLGFENMKISQFPNELISLKSLKTFNLHDNPNLNHQKLFKQLAQLPNLEELDLSATISATLDNKFAFPKELAELKKLRKLDLQQNRNINFDTLLDYLAQLPNFESLNLHFHRTGDIIQLPDKLKYLKNLKELNVSYSGAYPLSLITELPESLEKLDYSDARFYEDEPIQKVIFTAKNLKSLNLSGSSLKELPEEIGNLKNLVHLDLSYNQIRELPESITQCKKLKYLNLMYTYIAKDKAKRAAIEEMLPNTLIFFGEYEVWDPENN